MNLDGIPVELHRIALTHSHNQLAENSPGSRSFTEYSYTALSAEY